MTQAISLVANFAIDQKTVTVVTAYGNAYPGTLSTNYGASVSEWLTNSPVANGAATQYVCTGASVAGNDFVQVNPTNATLTLTNNATLTWSWTTNYWLATTTNGAGSVNVASTWIGIGSNISVTATPAANYHFTSWTGDTNGCAMVGNVITAAMTQARSIVANFTIDQKTVTVFTVYGNAYPGSLVTNYGSTFGEWITNSPVVVGGTQFVCAAGTVAGNDFTQVNPTNITLTLTNNAALTWSWSTNYYLTSTNSFGGAIAVGSDPNGWIALGHIFAVSATNIANYHFVSWSGDTNGCVLNGPLLTGWMTQARTITANFAIDQHVLTVASAHGGMAPGTTTNNWGTGVAEFVTNSPVVCGGTQYICTAGVVVSNDFTQVSATNVTLTLTNDSVLTWQWITNYQFSATNVGAGTVSGSTNGWYLSGAVVTVTGTPSAFHHFLSWSGDTNGCTITSNVISGPMSQARAVTATFVVNTAVLSIVSVHGTGTPSAGTYTNQYGTVLTNAMTGVDTQGGTQYVSTGWAMTGNNPLNGVTTNCVMTHTNDAVLTWLWQTNYLLSLSSPNGFITNASSGYMPAGSTYLLYPVTTNAAFYNFGHWVVDGVDSGTNVPFSVNMNQAHTVQAVFDAHFVPALSFADVSVRWTTNLFGTINAIVSISNRASSAKVMLAPIWYELPTNNPITRFRYPTGIDTNTGNAYVNVSGDFSNRVHLVGNLDYALDPGESVTLSPIEIWSFEVPNGVVVGVWADPVAQYKPTVNAFNIRLSADGKSVVWDAQPGVSYTLKKSSNLQFTNAEVLKANLSGVGALSVMVQTNQAAAPVGGNDNTGGAVFFRVIGNN